MGRPPGHWNVIAKRYPARCRGLADRHRLLERLALASIGGFIGALITPAVGRQIGTGRTFCVAAGVTFPFGLLIPLTSNGTGVIWYVLGAGVVAAGIAATNITAFSFLLAICPNDLLGVLAREVGDAGSES